MTIHLFLNLIFLLFSFGNLLFADIKINESELKILRPCYDLLLKNTGAGYVILGEKPLCMDGYWETSYPCRTNDKQHVLSIALFGAKPFLLDPKFQSRNIIFHYDLDEHLFFVINKELFTKTVNENLFLFQYILGPSVTADSLLNAILSNKRSFYSILNHERLLIGIVLGYGTENSLVVAREENINNVLPQDRPPLIPKVNACAHVNEKEFLLFFPTVQCKELMKNTHSKMFTPSWGYQSLEEESESLTKKTKTFENAGLTFGYIEEGIGNRKKIKSFKKAEKKISKLQNSPHLVENMLELITEERVIVEKSTHEALPTESMDCNRVLAKLLSQDLSNYSKQALIEFAQGLTENEETTFDSKWNFISFPEALENMRTAKTNLEEANHFFSQLKNDPAAKVILDDFLYFKTMKNGQGKVLNNETSACIDFYIYDPKGRLLNSGSGVQVNLRDMIPGFAYGLSHMTIDEEREVYIHPALGYGIHTFLDKGIYLKALVKLHDFTESKDVLDPLKPIDLSYVLTNEFQDECENEHKKAVRYIGMLRGQALKQHKGIDVQALSKELLSLENSELTTDEIKAINHLFWDSYFSKETQAL